ncbi:hypothetical protein J1614_006445 [Plenodomus biglobosus]|nr:hypothetical protein J1614_006445 [Plenodomus biglobosus]
MKLLFTTITLVVLAISTAVVTITLGPTTVRALPMVTILPTSLTSGTENYCARIGETRNDDMYKIKQCTEYHEWTELICPWGCNTDEGMKHCHGLPPSATSLAHHVDYCPTLDEQRCFDRSKVKECSDRHEWIFLRSYPLGCDNGNEITSCASSESSRFSGIPTTLLVTPSAVSKVANKARNDGPCKPHSRACDSERRFLFTCGDDGHWDQGRQCNRANSCKVQGHDGLTCAGHPHFYYDDDRICERERSCELMGYKYCLAGDPTDPAQQAQCLKQMCGMVDCRDCDRCSFHLQPGQRICPDLLTLWIG